MVQFNNVCLNLPESAIHQMLLYFCKECILKDSRNSLKIIPVDYSLKIVFLKRAHVKPLFKKHDILSIFNIYPYYCLIVIELIELYI